MNITIDEGLLDQIDKGLWGVLEQEIPTFANLETLCYISHIAVSQKQYSFLKAAVSVKDYPFYQKVKYKDLSVPILHRAVCEKDLAACGIILTAGVLPLCCAQNCHYTCRDTLDILLEDTSASDPIFPDIACLIISSWTKFLQKLQETAASGDVTALHELLASFVICCCTYRSYTDLSLRLDALKMEDLRDFTLLSVDPDSLTFCQRLWESSHSTERQTASLGKGFFNLVAEGAGKALNAVLNVGEQILSGGSFSDFLPTESDLLARRTHTVAAQLTQKFLNSMLISAIERSDIPIIDELLRFGFRLQAVPRPSVCLALPVDVHSVVGLAGTTEGSRGNPLQWRLGGPESPEWLESALRADEDTALLAVIRKNLLEGHVFSQLMRDGPHLLMLPGKDGVLPIHLMAALGRFEMLTAVLDSNDPSIDLVENRGLSAFLISTFYGQNDCVRALLDYPAEEGSVDANTIILGETNSADHVDGSLSGPLTPVEAFRSVPLQWIFGKDRTNYLIFEPVRTKRRGQLTASFNALHLAIITGNVHLLGCLLEYVKTYPEDYIDWFSPAARVANDEAASPSSDSIGALSDPLANHASAGVLNGPVGLACCLDDVELVDNTIPNEIFRLLATVRPRRFALPNHNNLLQFLLQRQRFSLVGGVLYLHQNQVQPNDIRSFVNWSNCQLCKPLPNETKDPFIFATLLTDWLSWSPLDAITKLNLTNNGLIGLPMCLITQLPQLQELDISCNEISSLPDLKSIDLRSIPVLAPNLIRLDLSNNFLISAPPWLFGSPVDGSTTFAPRLSILRLCGNRLISVPKQMWLAGCLQCLDLSKNNLVELPRASIEEVLSAQARRADLQAKVDIGKERDISCLPQLPNSVQLVTLLKSAKEHGFFDSAVTNVNPAAGNYSNGGLLHLWLQGNKLRNLPLVEPSASSQSMIGGPSPIPDRVEVGLAQLAPMLTSLDVSGNKLSGALPSPSKFPPNLVHLDLSNNRITAVVEGGAKTDLPNSRPAESDGQLVRLFHLNLRSNQISVFNPVSTTEHSEEVTLWFPELSSLDLSGNIELTCLGSSICRLEKLSSLELDGCTNLKELPSDLWRLSKLKSLTLFNTPAYARLVCEIRAGEDVVAASLKNSRHQRYKSRKTSTGVSTNYGLTGITNANNSEMPILNTKTVLDHLKSLPRSSKPYNKVRLMLIGSRKVGKTSLLKSLLEAEGQELKNEVPSGSSHVALTPFQISRRHPSDRGHTEWTETVDFTAWDFADVTSLECLSQAMEESVNSVLSAVQQFLMSKSTVFVVVWSLTHSPDGLHSVARHLVDIQTRAPNAPVLVVGTHADVVPPEVLEEVSTLAETCFLRTSDPSALGVSQQLVGHFIVDATDSGDRKTLPRIATAIHNAANQLRPPFRKPLIGTKYEPGRQRLLSYPVPLVYHDLEKVIRDLASDLQGVGIPPIVSMEDFVAEVNRRLQSGACAGCLESPEEVRSALSFLHEAGHLLFFPNLTRAVVLDPIWLSDLLLRLLVPRQTSEAASPVCPTRGGVLNLSRLKDLLVSSPTLKPSPENDDDVSTEEVERLMRRFQHLEVSFALTYLVSLLAKFELAAPLDSQNLLVPALLPLKRLASAPDRQIRITPARVKPTEGEGELAPNSGSEDLLVDSDPLNCTVYTLPRGRRSKTSILPAPQPESIPEDAPVGKRHHILSKFTSWHNSLVPRGLRLAKPKVKEGFHINPPMSTFFDRSDFFRRGVNRGRYAGMPMSSQPLFSWKLKAAPRENEVLRLYALAYIPAGFWARLITRLLTDSDLNTICGSLYNIGTIPSELRPSLLCLESHVSSGDSSPESLQVGWSLSRCGLQLTLAGGSLLVFTLEQVGNRVSIATATVEEPEMALEAHEMAEVFSPPDSGEKLEDDPSVLGGLEESDFKKWNLRSLRFFNGEVEEFRGSKKPLDSSEDGLIVEPMDNLTKYCHIQLHMPSFSILWPDYKNSQAFELTPDRRILTQILTKVVHHIDSLLEDWYPDLGTRFNQSNSGEYLIYRVVPCTECVRCANPGRDKMMDAVSTLDSILNSESSTNEEDQSLSENSFGEESHTVYAVLVEELVHWLLTPARKGTTNGSIDYLPCPIHSKGVEDTTYRGISGPDLVFTDVRRDMQVSVGRVTLDKFLGRGAFGSVFAGSAFFSTDNTTSPLTTEEPLLNLVKVPVGVKICSPIDPEQVNIRLSDWQPFRERATSEIEPDAAVSKSSHAPGPGDLRVALALYKQERRRWSFQPVESCYTAYQELRSELAVLMRVSDDVSSTLEANSSTSMRANSGSGGTLNHLLYRPLSRRSTMRRSGHTRPRLFAAMGNQGCLEGGRHLLTCLGVVSPRPLSLLLPLAPQGSLSDWMTEMLRVYSADASVYPVHRDTLVAVIHQVATALAYLHRLRIVYRDLKPDNLLVWNMPPPLTTSSSPPDSNVTGTLRPNSTSFGTGGPFFQAGSDFRDVHIVLSDFGVSRWRASLDGCRGYVGTPGFMAPEVLATLGEETYSHKVDIYALGVLMASIAKFEMPYHGFTNLRFQLNQHILSGGRPVLSSEVKSHLSAPYLDLMSLCWSHEPQNRPEASEIVKVTQRTPGRSLNALINRPISTSVVEATSFQRENHLSMTIATGFGEINSVRRLDAVEVVSCALIDSRNRLWIGGYSSQSDAESMPSGDAFFEAALASRIGRLVVFNPKDGSNSCGLACSWGHRRQASSSSSFPSALPSNLSGGGYPVALSIDDAGNLWCADSTGRLLVFDTSNLSQKSCISPSMEGDSIWMIAVESASVLLGLSTGWIVSASLKDSTNIRVTWSTNTLQVHRRLRQPTISILFVCAERVSKSCVWLGGSSTSLLELRRVHGTQEWQQSTSWKASNHHPYSSSSSSSSSKPRSHSCGHICDQSPSVTCLTSNFSDGSAKTRVWTYSYPDGEVTCWSVSTRTPLKSVKLDPSGGNQPQFNDTTCLGCTIGSVERLLWTSGDHLLAGTSHGSLLKIHWPPNAPEDAEFDEDEATFNSQIRCRVLRLHWGPAEPCFCLLSPNQTLGRGFVHPLSRVLPEMPQQTDCGSHFLVSLFPDNQWSCDFDD